MKGSRIHFIDIARAIAILLIVLGHTIVHNSNMWGFYKFIYSFHVILFFIVSGFVYNKKTSTKEFAIRKFLHIMVPYFAFSVLFIIPYYIFGDSVNDTLNANAKFNIINLIKEILYGIGYNGAIKQNTSLWFLPALFTTEIIYKLVDCNFLKKINCIIKIIVLFIISYLATQINILFPIGINTALVVLPFYYIGILIRDNKIIEKISNSKIGIASILILTILAIYIGQLNDIVSCVNYRYGNYFFFLFTSLIISLAVFVISYKISKNRILEVIGANTLSILLFHKLIVVVFQTHISFTKNILLYGNAYSCILTSFFVVILSVIISLLINYIIKKHVPFLYGENIYTNENSRYKISKKVKI